MDRGLCRGGRAPVDADVGAEQLCFVVLTEAGMGGAQPARTPIADLVVTGLLIGNFRVIELHRGIRLFLGKLLIEGLVVARLAPAVRGRVTLVEQVVDTPVDQGVFLSQLVFVVDAVLVRTHLSTMAQVAPG